MLKPLFDQLIPTVEQLSISQITDKAHKAKLPPDLVKQIGVDAKWPDLAKKGLEYSAPRVTAKWLNRFNVPSGSQDEILCVTSVITIVAGQHKVMKRLDEFIASQTAQAAKAKAEEKKP